MKNKYLFVLLLLMFLSLIGYGFTRGYMSYEDQGEEGITIVTSFYPMQIAAINVAGGCEGVKVECLSEPQTGCLHDYQLTPQDMILLSNADIFIVNGGGIENFLTDVAREYPDLVIIDAGEAIFSDVSHQGEEDHLNGKTHLQGEYHLNGEGHLQGENYLQEEHHHGENAHAWMSISHYMQQIESICQGLIQADPAHASAYRQNGDAYLGQIRQVQEQAEEIRALTEGSHIVIFHEAYEYLAEELGMVVDGLLDLDEERQVSAGEMADIINVIRKNQITVLLAEELYGQATGETIEQETGCRVYYLDTLVRGQVQPDVWLTGMQENLRILGEAFRKR